MRKALYLIGQLSDNDVEWIVDHSQRRDVVAGTVLIREGHDIDTLIILLDGLLEVTGTTLGKQVVQLGAGEVVGEISLLDSRPPTATVTAVRKSVILAIPREDLQMKLRSDVAFAARFYRALAMFLAHRLRNMVQKLGYGKGQPLQEEVEYQDELSPEILDSVTLAGARFDRVLQKLLAH